MIIDQAHIAAGDLSGQVAVITGAGSGIGREGARILAHLGAKVVIAEVSDSGRQVEQEIRAAGGAVSAPAPWTRRAWPGRWTRCRRCTASAGRSLCA